MVVRGTAVERALAIAAAQGGRVSRAQLSAAAISSARIKTMLRHGWLQPRRRGVYTVGPPTEVPWAAEIEALLTVDRGAVLSARSAAGLHGYRAPQEDHPVDIVLVGGRRARSRPGIQVHHSITLEASEITRIRALPVTTPVRTLLDLADVVDEEELEACLDEALALRRVTLAQVSSAVERSGSGRRGRDKLRRLLDPRRPSSLTRSEAERRLRGLILDAGIPVPHMNDPLHGYVADFHWREARYVVEVDGRAPHSTLPNFQRDRTKDRVLGAHGVHVDRFTWSDITRRQMQTIAHIAAAVARRTAENERRPAA